jgi:hypothetical protein
VSCCKNCKKWRHGLFKSFKIFSLPRGTLERYAKDITRSPEELVYMNLGRRTVLLSELKNKLLEYCIIMDQRYRGLRRQDIKRMAFHMAVRNVLKHPFNKKKNQKLGRNGLNPF